MSRIREGEDIQSHHIKGRKLFTSREAVLGVAVSANTAVHQAEQEESQILLIIVLMPGLPTTAVAMRVDVVKSIGSALLPHEHTT
jgi:hypothetical protein